MRAAIAVCAVLESADALYQLGDEEVVGGVVAPVGVGKKEVTQRFGDLFPGQWWTVRPGGIHAQHPPPQNRCNARNKSPAVGSVLFNGSWTHGSLTA